MIPSSFWRNPRPIALQLFSYRTTVMADDGITHCITSIFRLLVLVAHVNDETGRLSTPLWCPGYRLGFSAENALSYGNRSTHTGFFGSEQNERLSSEEFEVLRAAIVKMHRDPTVNGDAVRATLFDSLQALYQR